MQDSIKERLELAIRQDSARNLQRTRRADRSGKAAQLEFEPVRRAAEDIREQLESTSSIRFTINPSDVWITLADRDVWFGYDAPSRSYVGTESSHSWFDGELYTDSYKWDSPEICVEAMIRICARYARMARVMAGIEV